MRKKKRWLDFVDTELHLVLGTLSTTAGFKGNTFLTSGVGVYAPYQPLHISPLISNSSPQSFQPRNGVLSRYATKLVNPNYYTPVTFEVVEDIELVVGSALLAAVS